MAKVATKSIEGTELDIEFSNGSHVKCDLAQVPDEIKTKLALHGLSQKVGDSYAGLGGDLEAAIAAAKGVVEQLVAGTWTAARQGGGGGPRVTLLARAISAVMAEQGREVSIDEAAETISELDDETKKALRNDPAVKKAMAEIKLADAAKEAEGAESQLGSLFG